MEVIELYSRCRVYFQIIKPITVMHVVNLNSMINHCRRKTMFGRNVFQKERIPLYKKLKERENEEVLFYKEK